MVWGIVATATHFALCLRHEIAGDKTHPHCVSAGLLLLLLLVAT